MKKTILITSIIVVALAVLGVGVAFAQGTQPPTRYGMMGWMHDTLDYFKIDPIYRQHHQDKFSFSMMYFYDENFMLPLSHDEIVHGKSPMLYKMPGDEWQKFANLRSIVVGEIHDVSQNFHCISNGPSPCSCCNHRGIISPSHANVQPASHCADRIIRSQ